MMQSVVKQNLIVLAVSRYQIPDAQGKITAEGTGVRYIMANDLAHTENEQRTSKGYQTAKCNLPYSEYDKFPTVPGLYTAELAYSVDSKGVAKITPNNFMLVNPLNLAATGKTTGFPAPTKEAK